MRSSAAPRPTLRAMAAAAKNTEKLTARPRSSTVRYSQKMERSKNSRSESDIREVLLDVLGDELPQAVGPRGSEHLRGRSFLLDQAVVQEHHLVRYVAREAHLVRYHDHRRTVIGELAHHRE